VLLLLLSCFNDSSAAGATGASDAVLNALCRSDGREFGSKFCDQQDVLHEKVTALLK
jgi:hypothetical protein